MGISRRLGKKSRVMEKLASGLEINRAADDAAGLAVSEKMRAQIRGMQAAEGNTQDAISLVQTADGALSEVHEMLDRMYELTIKAANGIYYSEERAAIQEEIDNLRDDIDRIARSTNFNSINLLDGSLSKDAPGPTATVASYTSDINFANVNEGSRITIDGVTFEFDTDGACAPNSVVVDISSATGNTGADMEARAQSFQQAFEASSLAGKYAAVFETDGSGLLHMNLEERVGTKGEHNIAVEYQQIPDVSVDPLDIRDTPAMRVLTLSNLDLTDITTGTTLKVGNVLFEFRSAPPLNNPSAVMVDHTSSNFAYTLRAAMSGSALASNRTFNVSNLGNNKYKIMILDRSSDKLADMQFNPDGTYPNDLDGENVKSQMGGVMVGEPPGIHFQIGASPEETLDLYIEGASVQDLGLTDVSVSNVYTASNSAKAISMAVDTVSSNRAVLGAAQNRLEHTYASLQNQGENLTAAESRIRDTDMGRRVMDQVQEDIHGQAAQAILAQANHMSENILQLLQ